MTVQLRVVLGQAVHVVDPDEARAERALTAGLIKTAPRGCGVSAIVPSGADVDIPGLHDVRILPLPRRELAAAWQMGIAAGAGGGLIHAAGLMAPLTRHDRVHDHDQTTVTLWDLRAWENPAALPKASVMSQRAMLKRAVKHADAVVVPSHAMASRLGEIAALGDRIRVIAGAAPFGWRVPENGSALRTKLQLPERYVVLTGDAESLASGFRAAANADVDAVVLGEGDGSEQVLRDAAAAVGLPGGRLHIHGHLEDEARAAVLGGARAVVATSAARAWPWRLIEAMELGVPIVAVESGVHGDVIADGGAVVEAGALDAALVDAVGSGHERLRVLGADRARAFSWMSSGERLWALHAEL
ncbi:glycosyl transferase [Actinomycetales bacterium SN12]|nr:glycosyl transferase [Actinomycetales bacterium SN12]